MSDQERTGVSRREFLKLGSAAAIGVGIGGVLTRAVRVGDGVVAIPASGGYLVVDSEKCMGCMTCNLACSLAHEGEASLSLSRIQVIKNALEKFPDDISVAQCRQCVYPPCVEACPTGAIVADEANAGVRLVDESKCIGCMRCIEACPYRPARIQWNPESKHAQKCDLCANTPYWDGQEPACVTLCPMRAIEITKEIPSQVGYEGYEVDLKPVKWGPW